MSRLNITRILRTGVILVILVSGAWLLFQGSDLAPESPARQEAVQRALAPGRQAGGGGAAVDGDFDSEPVFGEAVEPVSVNIMDIPVATGGEGSMQEAYEAGRIDIGRIDSPFSDAVMDALRAESAAQPVDTSVEYYDPAAADAPSAVDALVKVNEFKSIDFNQVSGAAPPDPIITAGHKGIIAAVNTSFQGYDFFGNSLFGPLTFASFWGSSCGTGAGVKFFDPFLEYDEDARRYIVGITAQDPALNNGDNGFACIAISKSDSPNSDYWLYSFDGNPGGGTDFFFDYPHLGVGQKALFLEANMFGDSFVRSHVMAFDKVKMYAGTAAGSVKFNVPGGAFTVQPSKIHGKTTGGWPTNPNEPHYFVSSAFGNGQNTLTVWQFNDPFGTPSFGQAGTVTVDTYNMPLDQPQSGGNNVQANDNRMLDVKYFSGRLYATHTIGCNPGGGTVNCARLYIIDMSSGSPVLLDQGSVASSTGDFGRFFPAIATNMCGQVLLGYSGSGPNHFPGAYVIGRKDGAFTNELTHKSGEVAYTAFDSAPHRWGDYTGMAMDPNGRRMWYLGEYSRNQANTRWSTWIGEYEFTECTTQSTPTPSPTNTPIATATPTNTPENTPTPTATTSFTATPTATPETGTTCSIYPSTDVPVSIPDDEATSVTSVLNVPDAGTITNVNVVSLKGRHTWVQDLRFNLKSPLGTEVQVLDVSSCADGLQDFDLNLDDSASTNAPCPPVGGGTHKPTNPLSAFNGQEQSGTWTLRIEDVFSADGGSLDSWGLYICKATTQPTATPTPTTPPDATATNTITPTPTATNTATPDPEATSTATSTPRSTSTATPDPQATSTATPDPQATSTATPGPGEEWQWYMPMIIGPPQ